MNYNADWIPVQRDEMINYDLESTPLQIKTDSAVGSEDILQVLFYTSTEDSSWMARIWIRFYSPPKYHIVPCSDYTTFPSPLPSEVNKVWQITKLSGPRITIHCNGVKVLDIEMSDSKCPDSGNWKTAWRKDIEKIVFVSSDKASDYYSYFLPGNLL